MEIVDYAVVRNSVLKNLREEVLLLIRQGYVPLGGVGTDNITFTPHYIQTLVKKVDVDKAQFEVEA